jgi:hypothetical protein
VRLSWSEPPRSFRNSRELGSIQCASSSTIRVGPRAARPVAKAVS